MSLNLIVSKTDNVKVKVYCWEAEGEIEASHLKTEIPKDVKSESVEEFEFIFRKPGYADSNIIIRNSNVKMEDGESSVSPIDFQENILRTLLVDWDLKDEEGKKIALNAISVNNLVPNVARASVSGAVEKIRI